MMVGMTNFQIPGRKSFFKISLIKKIYLNFFHKIKNQMR
jgi:hypothetical protein